MEARAKRTLLALVMGALVPGLGHFHAGRTAYAAVAALAPLVVSVAVIASFVTGDRDLAQMTFVARAASLGVWIVQALHGAWCAYRSTTSGRTLGGYLFFVAVALVGARIVGRFVVGGLFVLELAAGDAQMAPLIPEGARVAVVRWKFDARSVRPGDVVCFEDARGGAAPAPSFARVKAIEVNGVTAADGRAIAFSDIVGRAAWIVGEGPVGPIR